MRRTAPARNTSKLLCSASQRSRVSRAAFLAAAACSFLVARRTTSSSLCASVAARSSRAARSPCSARSPSALRCERWSSNCSFNPLWLQSSRCKTSTSRCEASAACRASARCCSKSAPLCWAFCRRACASSNCFDAEAQPACTRSNSLRARSCAASKADARCTAAVSSTSAASWRSCSAACFVCSSCSCWRSVRSCTHSAESCSPACWAAFRRPRSSSRHACILRNSLAWTSPRNRSSSMRLLASKSSAVIFALLCCSWTSKSCAKTSVAAPEPTPRCGVAAVANGVGMGEETR
mmetsp:Transcript_124410/g.278047  ORF Transcript_124410/g.278047 Transcript_124410/m.278047 type:complete len:294 (-) Transcript_124410:492-1373(-)